MAPLNNLKKNYLISYFFIFRFFYYCFLFFLPLTLIFLAWHLFVENCKWNFAGEEGVVPRPWPHTIYIPMIWFFSFLFAVPTVFWSDVRPLNDDFYRNEISFRKDPENAQVSCCYFISFSYFKIIIFLNCYNFSWSSQLLVKILSTPTSLASG